MWLSVSSVRRDVAHDVTGRAIVIIDMLRDFIDPAGALSLGDAGQRIIPRVKERLSLARARKDLVLFACDRHRHDDAEFEMFPPHCIEGTPGADIIPELEPERAEVIIPKRRYSAFFGTDLDLALRERSVTEIELAGVCTNICVLYTAADARNLNYRVVVDASAVAGLSEEGHIWALGEMGSTLGCRLLDADVDG